MAKINWSDRSLNDIQNIIDNYAQYSEKAAKLRVQPIFQKIKLLESFPNIGRVVPELEYLKVREILVGQYRVVYHIVSENRIDILTVHHSSFPLNINELQD
jgi:toxin ParE1/3/4